MVPFEHRTLDQNEEYVFHLQATRLALPPFRGGSIAFHVHDVYTKDRHRPDLAVCSDSFQVVVPSLISEHTYLASYA
jgi:hypothetical protein